MLASFSLNDKKSNLLIILRNNLV